MSYIVADNEVIHAVGATADEAWKDFERWMQEADIRLLEDGEPAPEEGNFARKRLFTIRPATAELIEAVKRRGGGIRWTVSNSVACEEMP